jgi:NADPH:quinone reductase-like Zn-dependent oxidoreductase
MKAVTIEPNGHLAIREHSDPEPGVGEVLILILAGGVNNADLGQRAGLYPASPIEKRFADNPTATTSPANSSPGMSGGQPRVMAVVGSGPGNAFTWQKYLQVGDRVKAAIEGLGVEEFSIAAEA